QQLWHQYSEENRECMSRACDELKVLLAREEGFLRQMVKDEWIKLSDRNTKFFYSLIKWRRRKAMIRSICRSDGSVEVSSEEIGAAFVYFYSDLLGMGFELADHLERRYIEEGPILDQRHRAALDMMFCRRDVQAAIF
ncbi:hypothetical protein Dimus_003870, partial [Dionaea muscipula]